ncbi:OprO/OprP family phosphate-selective porin [Chitiniphilus purpureus]|uniref:OprO/OprP family phosphate-selective porin n=1 Tax=Chitiniphilus purpureus TaxID=2981137 RepID=A0ABY6DU88_9NEIS|nr:OprO/OprP family phosphate-selective porin [Chitiniphilus sp. CD1]UXY16611.1 OprO/OprP family phosphate-selective porin [Chitiniphilus sp. CD1]
MRAYLAGLVLWPMGLQAAPAADDAAPDAAALALADATDAVAAAPRDWALAAELGFTVPRRRHGAALPREFRLSLDGRLDRRLAPGWRVVAADRADARSYDDGRAQRSINTLKELYLGWQPAPQLALDLGRINTRFGVATGFNPTDFFKAGALRSVTSADPGSLRENRLGSGMLRGQWLWQGGAFTAIYAPKLAGASSDSPFSLDGGASNPRERWLLVASHAFSPYFNPQWLLFGQAGQPVQAGFNWSVLLGDATVAYLEWAGGRMPALTAIDGPRAFRASWAGGLTWTAPGKLSLTLEYQRDGAAADEDGWAALRSSPMQDYGRYRDEADRRQALTTREAAMLFVRWQDALINRLDLTGQGRLDLIDDSRFYWLEARWRGERTDLALQWHYNAGDAGSTYGAAAQRQVWQLLATHYF